MEKILFYSSTNLKSDTIVFEKLGITIRKLFKEEKEQIISSYSTLVANSTEIEYFKKFEDIRNNRENYSEDEITDIYRNVSDIDDKHPMKNFSLLYLYNSFIDDAYDKVTIENINTLVEHFYIIEIDENLFCKYFDSRYIGVIFPKIINFSNYINSKDGQYDKYEGTLLNFNRTINTNSEDFHEFIFYFFTECERSTKLNEDNLLKLCNMLNSRDTNFGFNFMMVIDNIFEDDVLIENRIVNIVSVLERLLISKEYQKQEMFVLKVGILCNKLFEITNEKLSRQLKEIYNIRSMIVHGNDDKILDKVDFYIDLFGPGITKGQNRYKTRSEILIVTCCILELCFINILNKYLDDTSLCEYIKQN